MNTLRTIFEAFRQGLRRGLGNRLTLVVGVVGAVIGCAAAVAIAMGDFAGEVTGVDFFGGGAYLLGLQAFLPLLACYLGAEVVHGEIADRSSTHLFVRPVSRMAVLFGRWLSGAFAAALVIAVVLVVSWVAQRATAPAWRLGLAPGVDLLGALVVGALAGAPAYAAVGALAGAAFKRPVVWSLAYVVGWEYVASNLPAEAGVRIWTVADPLRRLILEWVAPPEGSGLWKVLMGSARRFDPAQFPDPWISLLRFTAVALALALVVYARREYDSRARD